MLAAGRLQPGNQFGCIRIGPQRDLTYRHQNFGDSAAILADIVAGKHPFAETLKAAKKPMLILGMGALTRPDGVAILGAARKLAGLV